MGALIVTLVVYGLCAVALFVALMISFFRRYPEGAIHLDELELISYVTMVLIVAILWPLVLLGLVAAKQFHYHSRHQPAPTP